jgi:hypothetical protein
MALLQRILEMVEEDDIKNADIADRRNQQKSRFADIADTGNRAKGSKSTKSTTKSPLKVRNLEKSEKNAVNVACMREVENHLPSSSSYENKKINISYARASNNVNKTKLVDCNQCPAAGFWDYMGTGMWCFHRVLFLGKAGKPMPCETAKYDCPLTRKEIQNAD